MDQPNHATEELANESMRSPITMRNHVASERASEPVHPCRSGSRDMVTWVLVEVGAGNPCSDPKGSFSTCHRITAKGSSVLHQNSVNLAVSKRSAAMDRT